MTDLRGVAAALDRPAEGRRLLEFVTAAYPLPRSLTGAGVRATLDLIDEELGAGLRLTRHRLASGAPMLDWTAPREWVVREAWIKGPDGRTVVDVADHSLHLLGYSAPFEGRLSRAELDQHLYSLPEQPELIPYRTSYWAERWGFCLPHQLREGLPEGEYHVRVDTELRDGEQGGGMDWGELVLPGRETGEILLSAHICHPSLANDNLSAIAVAAAVGRLAAGVQRRHGLRILFAPATVGALAWLAQHQQAMPNIIGGLVLANLGDPGPLFWKRTWSGTTAVDHAAAAIVRADGGTIEDFTPFGYDERQYNSPGFRLPIGCLSRTPWGRYPEYHTSADNPAFLDGPSLAGSLAALLQVVAALDDDQGTQTETSLSGPDTGYRIPDTTSQIPDPASPPRLHQRYTNLAPFGEPQLGKRGLYRSLGGGADRDRELALLWVLSCSDGHHDLAAIVGRSGLSAAVIERATDDLLAAGLLGLI